MKKWTFFMIVIVLLLFGSVIGFQSIQATKNS